MSIYSNYFNLREDPFKETPDTRFYFESASHRSVMKRIESSQCAETSLSFVVGEVGVGKTMLTRILGRRLKGSQIGLILNPILSPDELFAAIIDELDFRVSPLTLREKLEAMENGLLEFRAENRALQVLIDEAQCLPQISFNALTKFHTYTKLKHLPLHVVLFGQPELTGRFQLGDDNVFRLEPISFLEMKKYISKRIDLVGGNGFCQFEESALKEVYSLSGGVPRLINRYCELAILMAEGAEVRRIDREIIKNSQLRWLQTTGLRSPRVTE